MSIECDGKTLIQLGAGWKWMLGTQTEFEIRMDAGGHQPPSQIFLSFAWQDAVNGSHPFT